MYKALRTFTGLVSMVEGEIKDIPNEAVAQDLLNVGYVEEIPAPMKEEPKPKKKRTPKGA